jgi:AraC-like DNA-binding protein
MGFPPRVFVAEQRLRLALALLPCGERTLADVALEAGYADQAHFTRAVRAATGRTPGALRRELARTGDVTFVQS